MIRSTGGQGRDVLHRAEAVERAARVHGIRYALAFDLAEARSTYIGQARIDFRLRSRSRPLFLDFRGSPTRLIVNGIPHEPDHRDHRLWLPDELLSASNRVEVEYENDFDVTGDGFHRFVDPEDGATYLYTNLEPFSAHRALPLLRPAGPQGHVSSSSSWRPGTGRWSPRRTPRDSSILPDGRRRHVFPATPPFSTYLFPLQAGPYERIDGRHGELRSASLGVAPCAGSWRRSAQEILEITAQGMAYYSELFGRPYPFSKYDQLFVPEFNAGAMENVGAVTFARSVPLSRPSHLCAAPDTGRGHPP